MPPRSPLPVELETAGVPGPSARPGARRCRGPHGAPGGGRRRNGGGAGGRQAGAASGAAAQTAGPGRGGEAAAVPAAESQGGCFQEERNPEAGGGLRALQDPPLLGRCEERALPFLQPAAGIVGRGGKRCVPGGGEAGGELCDRAQSGGVLRQAFGLRLSHRSRCAPSKAPLKTSRLSGCGLSAAVSRSCLSVCFFRAVLFLM